MAPARGAQLRDGGDARGRLVRADVARPQQTSPGESCLKTSSVDDAYPAAAAYANPRESQQPQHLAADALCPRERHAHGSEHVDGVGSEEDPRALRPRRRDDSRRDVRVLRNRDDHLDAVGDDPPCIVDAAARISARSARCVASDAATVHTAGIRTLHPRQFGDAAAAIRRVLQPNLVLNLVEQSPAQAHGSSPGSNASSSRRASTSGATAASSGTAG